MRLVRGFYKDSLTKALQNDLKVYPIRVVLIDADLYESTVPVLSFIEPMLQVGTLMLFDDWNCFNADNAKGERRAFQEFLSSHPDIQVAEEFSFGWHGQAFRVVQV